MWRGEVHVELRPVAIAVPRDRQDLMGWSLNLCLSRKSRMGIAQADEIEKLSYDGVRESALKF